MSHPKYIYHLTPKNAWDTALEKGYHTALSLETEGFIHASTESQTLETASIHYQHLTDLVLLKIDTTKIDDLLKYELAPKRGEEFPHIYGKLPTSAVEAVADFEKDENGNFKMPDFN